MRGKGGRLWALALAAGALLAFGPAAAAAPAEAGRLVEDALAAMGGRERVLAVKSLVMTGIGENPNLLQQMRPDAPLLVWMLPEWREAFDFDHGRFGMRMVRRPAFPAVFDNFRYDGRLDGEVAFDVGAALDGPQPPPPPRRASAAEAKARRLAMLHHPISALRAAAQSGAVLSNPRRREGETLVDLTTADGARATLGFDPRTRLLTSVSTLSEHALLGDLPVVTRFSGWEYVQPAGVRLPRRLTETVGDWPQLDVGVMVNTVDGDVGDLAAPEAVKAAAPPQPPSPAALAVSSAEAGPGVWLLSTANNYGSVLIEFADHLALMDAPQSEAWAQAIFVKARQLVPGKPLTQLIVSHFHADHAGGVRAAMAEGLTLYVHPDEAAFFRDVAGRRFSLEPDRLARAPRPVRIVPVTDGSRMADARNEVVLYHARNSTHGETLLMAWFPRGRMLAQADLWLPGSRQTPHAVAFAEDLAARGLTVEKHLPLHGAQIKSRADFEALVAALRSGAAR